MCSNRFFVQEAVYEQFVAALKVAMGAELRVGDGMHEGVTQGPLINEKAVQKVSISIRVHYAIQFV